MRKHSAALKPPRTLLHTSVAYQQKNRHKGTKVNLQCMLCCWCTSPRMYCPPFFRLSCFYVWHCRICFSSLYKRERTNCHPVTCSSSASGTDRKGICWHLSAARNDVKQRPARAATALSTPVECLLMSQQWERLVWSRPLCRWPWAASHVYTLPLHHCPCSPAKCPSASWPLLGHAHATLTSFLPLFFSLHPQFPFLFPIS